MQDKIDLKEDVFAIEADDRMLVGNCAMFDGEELMYAGRIRNSPQPQSGWLMILHPDDFRKLDKFYRRELN